MRLLLLCVISVFLSSKGFAQPSFYIRPSISFKYNTNSGAGSAYSEIIKPLPNPYLQHFNRRITRSGGFDFGIALGMQWKDKHKIELEYYREDTGMGYVTKYFGRTMEDFQGYASYADSYVGMSYGLRTNRVGLVYRNSFFESTNKIVELNANLGLGLYINDKAKDGSFYYLIAGSEEVLQVEELPNNVFYEGNYHVGGFNRGVGGYGLLGLGIELNTKRRNVICFDLNYIQGFSRLFGTVTTYKFDVDGEKIAYSSYGTARGSALQIQVSYRFQLYPWIKSKRKELQEQGVYKSIER